MTSRFLFTSIPSLALLCLITGCGYSLSSPFLTESHCDKANLLIAQADEKLAANDLKGNTQLLGEAASVDPTNPKVWWKLCEGC